MRNRYRGQCYRCSQVVDVGKGHFERFRGSWRVQHADCAIDNRGIPDPDRQEDQINKWRVISAGTGKAAQNARRRLREFEEHNGEK